MKTTAYPPLPVKLKMGLLYFVSILVISLISGFAIKAQRVYPDMSLKVSNEGSDYYIKFSWNGLDVPNCNDNDKWRIYRNGDKDKNIYKSGNGFLGNKNSKIIYVGPNYGGYWGLRHEESSYFLGINTCTKWIWSGFPRAYSNSDRSKSGYSVLTYEATVPLKKPTNPSATQGEFFNYIVVSWGKGTDLPNNKHDYEIYRGDTLVATVNGSTRSWKDTGVEPGNEYTYYIRTSTNSYGGHKSSYVNTIGSTMPDVVATDGEFSSRVRVSWQDMPDFVKSIRISRDGEELKIEDNMNASQFSDYNPVPGYKYVYSITPLDKDGKQLVTSADTGYIKPNGRIYGEVKAPFGGPVEGAIVYALRISDVPQGETDTLYSDSTNVNGQFDIRNIYYYDEATFKVYPVKGVHGFNPSSFNDVLLDLNAPTYQQITFTDTSSFTVEGSVVQVFRDDTCYVEDAEIRIDDIYKGIKTDKNGDYVLTVDEIGEYTFAPNFKDHKFSPAKRTYQIESDIAGVTFQDISMDTLRGYVKAGCDIYIGQADLRIINSKNPTGSIDTIITTSAGSGYYEIVLPSREYLIELTNFYPENEQDVTELEVLEFFGTKTADLTDTSATIDFIYRKPPEIEIAGFPDGGCGAFDGIPIMVQLQEYLLEIQVFESFGNERCLTSEGYVVIYDMVQEEFDAPDTIPLEGGIATYDLIPGTPNIIDPYKKQIEVYAYVAEQNNNVTQEVLVTGNRPREKTFTTQSPQVPFMILRDPPGDGSYSFFAENTTSQLAMRMYAQLSGSVNVWGQAKLGIEQEAGFGVYVPYKAWGSVKNSFEMGGSLKTQAEYALTISNTEEFKTSDNPNITGESGDIFIGSAMNMIYALTDVLDYNPDKCNVEMSQDIIIGTSGFETDFIYTEGHISKTLIPQLKQIRDIYIDKGSDSAKLYQNQIDVWEQTLQNNRNLKKDAKLIENKSFSAGADYTSTTEVTTAASVGIEFSLYIENTVAAEAGLEIGGAGLSGGVETKFRMETGGSVTGTLSYTKTTGYMLSDDDEGDFFSVDVKADEAYTTPVFTLVSGRSSCPWETGTQPREGVQLLIDQKVRSGIEPDGQGVFVLNLGNNSQSDEDRSYYLTFLQESNPDGAILTLGGSQAQGGVPTPYSIEAFQSIDATVTVEKGPIANSYQDLEFVLASGCDDKNIADTVAFSVYFNSSCSPVTLKRPFDGWEFKKNSGDMLRVIVADYDKTMLNLIALQYSVTGKNQWQSTDVLLAEALDETSATIDWDVRDIKDGRYDLRLKVECGDDNNLETSYSQKVSGIIDRTPPEVFGIPEPSDRIFDDGDEISVMFNEQIDCYTMSSDNVTLINLYNDEEIPVDVGCNDNKIIVVPKTETTFGSDSFMVEMKDVADMLGNKITSPITWKFEIKEPLNFKQEEDGDTDEDGILNSIDNCPYSYNPEQEDTDGDGVGDACDTDIDDDGILNYEDNCVYFVNPDQEDDDEDGVGNVCEDDNDGDGDGIINSEDNCPFVANADQLDTDNDGIGDVCDDDRDGDGVVNQNDNCPGIANPGQEDENNDGYGDPCQIDIVSEKNLSLLQDGIIGISPNPFSGITNVEYNTSKKQYVSLLIYNVGGELVKSLVNANMPAGKHSIEVNRQGMPNGIYMMKLQMKDEFYLHKLVVN